MARYCVPFIVFDHHNDYDDNHVDHDDNDEQRGVQFDKLLS